MDNVRMDDTILDARKDTYGDYTTKGKGHILAQQLYITGLVLKNATFSLAKFTKNAGVITWEECMTKGNIMQAVTKGLVGGVTSAGILAGINSHYQENYVDNMGFRVGSIANEFNESCQLQDANTQLFCQYALHGATAGASPYALMYKAFAETGGYDLQGMLHRDSETPYYNGPGQTGYAKLIDYVRMYGADIEMVRENRENDPRVTAIHSFLTDQRLGTDDGRLEIERDLLDGRIDYVETIIIGLANDPEFMGQVVGAEIRRYLPELLIENLPEDPVEHLLAVQERVGQLMLHNLAGPNGNAHLNYLSMHYPEVTIGDTAVLSGILPEISQSQGLPQLSTTYFANMAEANQTTIFTEGLNTRFGDIPRLSSDYVLGRSYAVIEELTVNAIGLSSNEVRNFFGDSTPAINNDSELAVTNSLRPRARPDGRIASLEP